MYIQYQHVPCFECRRCMSTTAIISKLSGHIEVPPCLCVDKHKLIQTPYSIAIMMTSSNGNISALLFLCAVNSPHKGQRRGALMFSLICVWSYNRANNRDACDLRRHRGHYDVIVMILYMNYICAAKTFDKDCDIQICTRNNSPLFIHITASFFNIEAPWSGYNQPTKHNLFHIYNDQITITYYP